MPTELTANEARVIGCLMEKSVVTPDQYPMTLNALTNACNQKSSRDPVMSLEPGTVKATVRALEAKHLLRTEENFRTQVEKYVQRLCNTPFSDYQLEPPEFAVITVLLLRGPRTPGELRANSGRLHSFADNAEVEATLKGLIEREGGPLVVQLPRQPGRRDPEYMHLLSGEVEMPSAAAAAGSRPSPSPSPPAVSGSAGDGRSMEHRVAELERQVTELRRLVDALSG